MQSIDSLFPLSKLYSRPFPVSTKSLHRHLEVDEPYQYWIQMNLKMLNSAHKTDYVVITDNENVVENVMVSIMCAADLCLVSLTPNSPPAFDYFFRAHLGPKDMARSLEKLKQVLAGLELRMAKLVLEYGLAEVLKIPKEERSLYAAKLRNALEADHD